jgi:hypothetical protein
MTKMTTPEIQSWNSQQFSLIVGSTAEHQHTRKNSAPATAVRQPASTVVSSTAEQQ